MRRLQSTPVTAKAQGMTQGLSWHKAGAAEITSRFFPFPATSLPLN